MAHKLAEETIAEILAYSLDVPDEDFASLAELAQSPFVNRQTSSSTALVVCKRWMRIGTPLLYSTAVLRSTAQANALAFALKANPTFGSYVKKLRIEGGYGVSVRKMIEMAPNLTDLWLLINYASDDRAKPMCAALEKAANIRRLIIYRPLAEDIAKNANTRHVISTLVYCIKSWTSLRIVYVDARTISMLAELGTVLLAAHHLEEFYFPEPFPDLATFLYECPANVKRIRVGWVDPGHGLLMSQRPYTLPENDRFPAHQRAKIVFTPPVMTASVAPPANPLYEPMKDVPLDVCKKIWSRVFELLLVDCPRISWYDWTTEHYRPVKECLSVCSEFRDVMLELACRHPDLRGLRAMESFTLLLKQNPHLALLVDNMTIQVSGDFWLGSKNADRCFDLMKPVIPAFINMSSFRISDYALNLEQFACLAPVSENLHELKVHLRETCYDSCAYYGLPTEPLFEFDMPTFASLRTLSLTLNKRSIRYLTPPPPHALNALERLILDGGGCADFLGIISPLRLEALRVLEVAQLWDADAALDVFCGKHGKKLSGLTCHEKHTGALLLHCSNIEYLAYLNPGIVYQHPPLPENFRMANGLPQVKLKEISCPRIDLHTRGRGDKQRVQDAVDGWGEFFDFLLRDGTKLFPALDVVRVGNQSELWPTTERDISKSPVPGWAEQLLSKGIRLVNAKGTGWTPRLKTQRKVKPI